MVRSRSFVRAFVVVSLASPLCAAQWVVDASGGGDFLDLPPAIAAAAPGDVLLVVPGEYTGFLLEKPLSIVGLDVGVRVAPLSSTHAFQVANVAAPGVVVLAGLTTNGALHGPVVIALEQSTATIVVDGLDHYAGQPKLGIVDCADVRIRNALLYEVTAISSRLELCDSVAYGFRGVDGAEWIPDGGPGTPAAFGSVGFVDADLHVYRSSLYGGDGGHAYSEFAVGGRGGAGVEIAAHTRLLLAGRPEDLITGGLGGWPTYADGAGVSGELTMSSGFARVSGVTVSSYWNVMSVEFPVPADPVLFVLGASQPGQTTTFRVRAAPGATVDLLLGRNPTVVPHPPLLAEDLLVVKNRTFHLGTVGPSGVVGFNFPVPALLPQGFTFFAQAKVTFSASDVRYTNSVPLVLR
ncbi:MAG: hypothetical protein L6Q99_03840 [Planctomycetes bacterium]|nr:hypothetical protein [Planctomycetota bacterium]